MSKREEKSPDPEMLNPPKMRSKIRKVPERPDRVLRERSENTMTKRPRKVSFTPGLQGSPCVDATDDDTLKIKAYKTETVTRRPPRRKTETKESHQVCNEYFPIFPGNFTRDSQEIPNEIPRTNSPCSPNPTSP